MIPASHHGRFTGLNRLWFEPGTTSHDSAGELIVSANQVAVRWAHGGVEKLGTLTLSGPTPACKGDYSDTFHASSGMTLHGWSRAAVVELFGTYPAGDGSPDWGWRITLDWNDPDFFTFRMFNVYPDGQEAIAVDLRGARQT